MRKPRLKTREGMNPYPEYRVWRTENLRDEVGVIVATDVVQEWLLPWWWEQYRKHNSHPVAFIDFGMSDEKKEWCRERGEFVDLPVADNFVKKQHEIELSQFGNLEDLGQHYWVSRNAWFKKPLAFLQSPFKTTIWIDLDCEVRGPIGKLFDFADHPSGIGIVKEQLQTSPKISIYSSGVVVYQRGLPLIQEWADSAFSRNEEFLGDQDLLSQIIAENKLEVANMPFIYNWAVFYGANPDALIYHWGGEFGRFIIKNKESYRPMSYSSLLRTLIPAADSQTFQRDGKEIVFEYLLTIPEMLFLATINNEMTKKLEQGSPLIYLGPSTHIQNMFNRFVESSWKALEIIFEKPSPQDLDVGLFLSSIWEKTKNYVENLLQSMGDAKEVEIEQEFQRLANETEEIYRQKGDFGRIFTRRQVAQMVNAVPKCMESISKKRM